MSSDLLDEWDETFLEQAIQLELDATSSRNPVATTPHRSLPLTSVGILAPLPPATFSAPAWNRPGIDASGMDLDVGAGAGFSPPRELSQRFLDREDPAGVRKDEFAGLEKFEGGVGRFGIAERDREIERLKWEVKRVSKQLAQMEHDCSELKKDKARKDSELKSAFSQLKEKDAEIDNLKKKNLQTSKLDHMISSRALDNPDINQDHNSHLGFKDTRRINGDTKEVGHVVSIEASCEPLEQVKESSKRSHGIKRKENQSNIQPPALEVKVSSTTCTGVPSTSLAAEQRQCKKAVGIQTELVGDYLKDDSVPHDISRKLFAIWEFSCSSMSGQHLVSKLFSTCPMDFSEIFRSMAQPADLIKAPLLQPLDLGKLSHFNETLAKVSKGMAEMETLLEVLLDLGMVENVLIVCRSLRILQTALRIIMGCRSRSHERSSIITSQSDGENISVNAKNFVENPESGQIWNANMDGVNHSLDRVCKNSGNANNLKSVNADFLVFLVKRVQKIMAKNTDEQVFVEALSTINLVVMGGNRSLVKERFGLDLLQCLPKYLQKDVGSHVQNEALQILFLLFNCSELLQVFCKQCEVYYAEAIDAPDRSPSASIAKPILEALAGCLMRKGNDIIDLKIRRKAVIILAFLAALGSPGAEVLWLPTIAQSSCFLDLITQVLDFEIDEVDRLAVSEDLLKERFTVMREALILLNRLASNANCSKAVLGALTRSNASASLTVDVASRISQRSKGFWKYHGAKRLEAIEAEVIDLARSYRTRVLSFIAGSIS